MKPIKVVPDILKQIQDNHYIKIWFLFAFFSHYIGKNLGFKINFFPEMKIRLDDSIFYTRKKTIDFWMIWKNYEEKIKAKIDKIKDKGTFIDVGANIGRYSVLMSKKGWKVYSFEPIKSNFERLKKNLKINNMENKAELFNFALGDKKEKRNISFEKYKQGEASIYFKNKNSVSENIEIFKLDDILHHKELKKPIILKIDVEGFEYEVLKGAEKFIKKYKPILILEIWKREKDINFLKKLNYKNTGEFWQYVNDK